MKRPNIVFTIIYLVVMIGAIVGLDIAFWQHNTEGRLINNIITVVGFLVVYLIISRIISKRSK